MTANENTKVDDSKRRLYTFLHVPVMESTPLLARQSPTNVAAAPVSGWLMTAVTGPPSFPNKASITPVQSESMARKSNRPTMAVVVTSNAFSKFEDNHRPSTDEHGVSSGCLLRANDTIGFGGEVFLFDPYGSRGLSIRLCFLDEISRSDRLTVSNLIGLLTAVETASILSSYNSLNFDRNISRPVNLVATDQPPHNNIAITDSDTPRPLRIIVWRIFYEKSILPNGIYEPISIPPIKKPNSLNDFASILKHIFLFYCLRSIVTRVLYLLLSLIYSNIKKYINHNASIWMLR